MRRKRQIVSWVRRYVCLFAAARPRDKVLIWSGGWIMSPGVITNPFILSCFFEDHRLPRVVDGMWRVKTGDSGGRGRVSFRWVG